MKKISLLKLGKLHKRSHFICIYSSSQPSSSDQDPLCKGGTSTQEASIYKRFKLTKKDAHKARYKYAMLGW